MNDERTRMILLPAGEGVLLLLLWTLVFPLTTSMHRSAVALLAAAQARENREKTLAAHRNEAAGLAGTLKSLLAQTGELLLPEDEATMLPQKLTKVCTLSGVRLERFAQSGKTPVRTSRNTRTPDAWTASYYLAVTGPWSACRRFLVMQARRLPGLLLSRIDIENQNPETGEVRMTAEMIAFLVADNQHTAAGNVRQQPPGNE